MAAMARAVRIRFIKTFFFILSSFLYRTGNKNGFLRSAGRYILSDRTAVTPRQDVPPGQSLSRHFVSCFLLIS